MQLPAQERIVARRVRVQQLEDGWEAQDLTYGWVRRYKTASGVLKAINRADKKNAKENNISTITNIEWNYINEIGRLVIQAISS